VAKYNGGYEYRFITNRKFRDVSAWYHIVVAFDTTQGTESNRVKIYVNGTQETSFEIASYPSQNFDTNYNTVSLPQNIGKDWDSSNYFDGSMAYVHFIDGTAYDATAFGEYDANGVWKINTSPSVTYGTNGFFILKNGNSVTDQSGNSNNFTVGGGTLTKTEDSPSNVFATLNSLDRGIVGTAPTIANGNNTWTSSGNSTGQNPIRGTLGNTTGKFYWEAKTSSNQNHLIGVCGSDTNLNFETGSNNLLTYPNTTLYLSSGATHKDGSQVTGSLTAVATDNIMQIAVDITNLKFYIGINGTWLNSADPATGTNAPATLNSGICYLPVCADYGYTDTVTLKFNFGNGYFGTTAVASAGTNASGIGIFEYDVPNGFTALSTKGLNL
jgi:hypothetical protein